MNSRSWRQALRRNLWLQCDRRCHRCAVNDLSLPRDRAKAAVATAPNGVGDGGRADGVTRLDPQVGPSVALT